MPGEPTPRPCWEIISDSRLVFNCNGEDVTGSFERDAREVVSLAELFDTPNVLLQGRSPSCAVHTVHEGTFMRKLVRAKGITAALPGAKGLTLFTLAERAELLRNLNR